MFRNSMIIYLLLSSFSAYSIDASKSNDLFGFKYEKKIKSIDGRSIRWNVSLFPNGRFTWYANTTDQNKLACSKSAGYFSSKLSDDKIKSIVKLAYESARRQKSNDTKPTRSAYGSSLNVEYGSHFINTRISNGHIDEHRTFLKQMNENLKSSFLTDKNRVNVLEISAVRLSKNSLAVELSNIGKLDMLITLDKNANYSFKVIGHSDSSIKLKYPKKFKKYEHLIRPNQKFSLNLIADKDILLDKQRVIFVNKEINGPKKSMDLRLCSQIEGDI
ncbi:hypothetical protein [Halobacteriovorax sp. HLS]|uniref:hypothetical protein n=1 Tax=Halobacteriovorax sp. HLS TaxID=2234000 RepID=UPI000FD8E8D2|nr:hypothetical protein [Halobacteriovorax sp. HLS]